MASPQRSSPAWLRGSLPRNWGRSLAVRSRRRVPISLTWRLATTIFFAEKNINGAFDYPLSTSPIARLYQTFFLLSVERTTSPPGVTRRRWSFIFRIVGSKLRHPPSASQRRAETSQAPRSYWRSVSLLKMMRCWAIRDWTPWRARAIMRVNCSSSKI